MKTVCELNQCAGCMACVNRCPKNAISVEDEVRRLNAVIDEEKCVSCGLCENVCPQINKPATNCPIGWFQGWAEEQEIRYTSTSGGAAACITKAFIEKGGYVCSCMFDQGEFLFRITNSKEESKLFAGSKYVKSNPGDIFEQVKQYIENDREVLFIGLPCQVAGLKNYLGRTERERLFTVDLICHGTPSIKLLDTYLKQNGLELRKLKNIKFRSKTGMGLSIKEANVSMPGTIDAYLLSFLNALNYTDNCYSCQYASLNRVSDITLGDNWGTEYSDELAKGVSLILVNSEKGKELLINTRLILKDVDVKKAISANGQLSNPSKMPSKRDEFMNGIEEGKKYKKLISRLYRKQYMRQILKGYAIKLRLRKMGGV